MAVNGKSRKQDYNSWSKLELIREINKLEKRKKYGLIWDEERTKEIFEEEVQKKLPVLTEIDSYRIDNTEYPTNVLIEGDNYHALSVLNYTHQKKIDVIYIDPPYNTGNGDSFRYNDRIVDWEDAYHHSKWLSFMSKRLKLAKKILKNTGVIFISIDDNEIAQLKLLCDEIFSENNLLSILVWDLGTGTQAGHFTRSHEYILAYAKNKEKLKNFSGGQGIIDHSALKIISYKNPASKFTFPKGTRWDAEDYTELKDSWGGAEKTKLISGRMVCKNKKLLYDVTLESGWAQKKQMLQWFSGKETFDSKDQKVLEFYFNRNGVLRYRKERVIVNPKSVLRDVGSTKSGSETLKEFFNGEEKLKFPKSVKLIKRLLELTTDKNSIVLDFFAGSGTTGQAVLELNNEDGGNRKFILGTNNEGKICTDVCYPRLQKIIQGYKNSESEKIEGLGGHLRYFKTNFVDSEPTDKNKKIMVEQSTEMLCLKEDCFDLIKEGNRFKIFKNPKNNYLGIIYYYDAIEPFKKEVKQLGKKINTYVFSLSDVVNDEEFAEVKKLVDLKPIPYAILNVYRSIFTYVQTKKLPRKTRQ